jgi:hypothetical protein
MGEGRGTGGNGKRAADEQSTGQLVDSSTCKRATQEGEVLESTQFVESRVGRRKGLNRLKRRIGQEGKDKGGES